MTMEFKTTEIPEKTRTGRKPLPNPFVDAEVFPADDEAFEFVIEQGIDSVEARRALRQLRQAAKDVDRTARTHTTENEDGSVSFVVWTVKRMERKADS